VKGKEDRRDREREKEPAWMDSDVPSSFSGGIFGGKGSDEDGMDSIQVWKKSMKEKEDKTKVTAESPKDPAVLAVTAGSKDNTTQMISPRELDNEPVDEIQMFRMMMMKEQSVNSLVSVPPPPGLSSTQAGAGLHGSGHTSQEYLTEQPGASPSSLNGSALLSLLTTSTLTSGPSDAVKSEKPISEPPRSGSRFFPTPLASSHTSSTPPVDTEKPSTEVSSTGAQAPFNPPVGPRLLSLGRGQTPSHGPSSTIGYPPTLSIGDALPSALSPPGLPTSQVTIANEFNGLPDAGFNIRSAPAEPARPQAFSPFDDIPQTAIGGAELSRSAVLGSLDRAAFGQPSDSLSDLNGAKTSRFAKYFDGKREPQNEPGMFSKSPPPVGFSSNSPVQGQRPDALGNPMGGGQVNDARAMTDIFAMLHNSVGVSLCFAITWVPCLTSLSRISSGNL
jgi:hypothetical protein